MSDSIHARFWSGKKVFLTGHTGFKGGWLAIWLASMGAKVTGFSRMPVITPNLYQVASVGSLCEKEYIGDICNLELLRDALRCARPEIVIHMAAQSLVRYSYVNPIETYATNVMGTAHVLESIRSADSVRAAVVVTTDKCYENKEWVWPYRESDPMGGYDPYSSSKGCAELVTAAYRQSFYSETDYEKHRVSIATCRAGNVIGGGDWSQDRLIPDALASVEAGKPLRVRSPHAIRPWQHVLDPLSGYLLLAHALYEKGAAFDGAWNFGPQAKDAVSVSQVIELFNKHSDTALVWEREINSQPHEAHFLRLDCSKAQSLLDWQPRWPLEVAIEETVKWHQAFKKDDNMLSITQQQIGSYLSF